MNEPSAGHPLPTGRLAIALASDRASVRWFAALLTALGVILSLPTVELPLFGLLAWIPLLLWLPHAGPRRRFAFGWLVGILYQLVIFRWIPFTVTEMTAMPPAVAYAMCGVYALWHGLQIGAFALLARPLHTAVARGSPALAWVAVALLFSILEWLWPVVFPWAVSHAAWQILPVHNIAAFFGVPGVTFFMLLPQVAVAAWLSGRLGRAPPRGAGAAWLSGRLGLAPPRRGAWLAPALIAVVLLGLGTMWWRLAATAEPEQTLRVAVVQPNYTLEEKKKATLAVRSRLMDRFEAQLRALPPERYDLIVASEGSFPLYWRVDTPPIGEVAVNTQLPTRRVQEAIANGPRTRAMIGGLRQVLDPVDGKGVANSVVFFEADGRIAGSYDKRLLVPFSEYMPLSDVFPSLADAVRGIGNLRRGDTDCAFPMGAVEATCGICYETLFANETRDQVGGARLLANFTIDTWFGTSTAPRLHLASHSTRAVELGLPLIRSALTGISAVIHPSGELLGSLPLDTTGVLEVEVPILTLTPPFRVIGPLFAQLSTALLAGLLLWAWWRRRREKNALAVELSRGTAVDRTGSGASGLRGSEHVQRGDEEGQG